MKILYFVIFILTFQNLASQENIALPEILNFSKKNYGEGTQNWGISQASNGMIYIANNDGLLSYDGTSWKIHSLPNKTIVRSLAISSNGKILVGGQGELGYFYPSDSGKLKYYSLLPIIPESEKLFDDVWSTASLGKNHFFRVGKKIFHFSDDKLKIYKTGFIPFMDVAGGNLYIQDIHDGILKYENGTLNPLPLGSFFSKSITVTGVIAQSNDSLLISTLWDGLYWYAKNKIAPIKKPSLNELYKAGINVIKTLSNSTIAVGTRNNGVYVINREGDILYHYHTSNGLQNKYVHNLFVDSLDNIWAALDNGISYIKHSSPIQRILPESEGSGGGYAARIAFGYLWIGTNNGLYKAVINQTDKIGLNKAQFSFVNGSNGQIWSIKEINNRLFIGRHEGALIYDKLKSTPINLKVGIWNFQSLNDIGNKNHIVAGTYKGIKLYENLENNEPKELAKVEFESSRFLEIEDNKSWISHPYKGVFYVDNNSLLSTPTEAKAVKKKNGIVSQNDNFIFKIRNSIVATTSSGILRYDSTTESFVKFTELDTLLPLKNIHYLKEDNRGNIWIVYDKKLAVLDFTNGIAKLIHIPEFNNKLLSGFESIYFLNERNIFISADQGFFLFDYLQYKLKNEILKPLISKIRLIGTNEREVYSGFSSSDELKSLEISPIWKTIHIDFSAPAFGQQDVIEYSVQLKGYESNWSMWSKRTEKEYTNLPPGKYDFLVKVRNNLGNESEPVTIRLIILPPWYLTNFAYLLYTLLLVGAIILLYKWQKYKIYQNQKKHEEEKARLTYLQQLELEKNEKEIIKLNNEKLEAELELQHSELAQATMHLVQKAEAMNDLKEKLLQLTNTYSGSISVNELKKMIKTIGEDENIDKGWDQFAQHFDKVHRNFLENLKINFPMLTIGDLKLCAYLRMNLSTKEIAQLLHITSKSVELNRYRLRKKLGLQRNENLYTFLIQQSSNS